MEHQGYRLAVLSVDVDPQWIDMNGHVSDRNYAKVFSDAEVAFLERIGVNRDYRVERGGHVYTAETHVNFLREILPDDAMEIFVGLVDSSTKAIHLSFEMRNREGVLCAHHETLQLHVRKNAAGNPDVCDFDDDILVRLNDFEATYSRVTDASHCRKPIGIRR